MKRLAGALAVLVLLGSLPTLGAAEPNRKHDFKCESCHSIHQPKGTRLWPSKPVRSTAKGTPLVKSDALCYTCHRTDGKDAHKFEPGKSHPINVSPSKKCKVSPTLPLTYVKGIGKVMTCTTCHDPHNRKAGFLRITNKGNRLCLACHPYR